MNKTYRRYVLGTLTVVYTLNFLDRGLIGLLLQPIKEDLHLSDTQLGALTGIAFGLFYATFGVPIARWADRGNRVTITSIAIGLWGVTVMACLFVSSFFQLVMARIAAAVGEAGCMPPTYSLVGDYFPDAAARTRAMAVYMLAGPVSALVSFTAGGWLNEEYGWRLTFFLMGIPGLVLAFLVKSTIEEPRVSATQQSLHRIDAAGRSLPPLSDVCNLLWHQRASRHLIAGIILLSTVGAGLAPWYAAFMMRTHGMGTVALGVWLGLIIGCSGIVGILLGGYVSGRWFAHDDCGQMRLSAVMIGLLTPCFVLFLFLPDRYAALIALMPMMLVCNFFIGPTFALMQRLVVDEMRATTLALVMLLANLIGMGIGPQAVGIISDVLAPALGKSSLQYAMLAMSVVALWSAYHFWQVGRTVNQDLKDVTRAKPSSTDDYSESAMDPAR